MQNVIKILFALALTVFTVNAVPLQVRLGDAVCEDGGNTACYVYCKAEGYSSGHCVGTEPFENCLCTNSHNIDTEICFDGDCLQECLQRNCGGGFCVPNGPCVCTACTINDQVTDTKQIDQIDQICEYGGNNDCNTYCVGEGHKSGHCYGIGHNKYCVCKDNESTSSSTTSTSTTTGMIPMIEDWCTTTECSNMCRMRGGCVGGYCVNPDQCNCIGCHRIMFSTETCDMQMCSDACHANGCNFPECQNDECICDCNQQKTDIAFIDNPLMSCQVGGRAACITSCKVQGCETGYCEGTSPNEVCVCSRCSEQIEFE
jgi:hypothetical protein